MGDVRMRVVAAVAAVAGLAAGGGSARAGFVVVEPDAFAAGTDISNSFPGVTLSDFGPAAGTPAVFSRTAAGSTGTRVFTSTTSTTTWNSTSRTFRADFALATDYVSLDIIRTDTNDPGFLRAFNSSNVLVAEVTTPAAGVSGSFTTALITRPTRDIAYVTASGVGSQTVRLDRLVYNNVTAVPVPPTAPLGLAGAAVFGGLRRARRRLLGPAAA